MNLDPRSQLLNTEMGVLVECPALAEEVARFFELVAGPRSAFHVELTRAGGRYGHDEHLSWVWDDHGTPMSSERDPEVGISRRLEVELLGMLPIQGLL